MNWADPVHTAAEQARQDSAGEVLHSSRGIREAQGRIRGKIRPYWIFFFVFP